MKKTYINDIYTFVFCVLAIGLFSFGGIMGYISTPEKVGRLVCVCVFGFFVLLCSIILAFYTEFIVLDEKKVVCVKLLKRATIRFADISEIQTTDKYGMGMGGVTAVWKITDTGGQSICIARFKRRKRWIEYMKSIGQTTAQSNNLRPRALPDADETV